MPRYSYLLAAILSSHMSVLRLLTQETGCQTLSSKLRIQMGVRHSLCPQGTQAWARELVSTPNHTAW